MLRSLREYAVKQAVTSLPRGMALRLCKGRPGAARLLAPGIRTEIGYYLGEYRVLVDTTFPIEREMVSGLYDRRTLKLFRRQIKPGSVCIDVGANVGALTLAMAQLCGPEGRVLAAEPGAANFRKLSENVERNANLLKRVRLLQVGLSDREGTLQWEEDTGNPGNAFLKQSGGSESVRVTTLDALLAEYGERRPIDFIKIDVEGMELDVLRGADKLLWRDRPTIYFESQRVWREKLGAAHFQAIEDFFISRGYKLHRVVRNGNLQPTEMLNTSQNTLAVYCG